MIDTTKYAGHTAGPWIVWGKTSVQQKDSNRSIAVCDYFTDPITGRDSSNQRNAILIADAPLLLEEINRLQDIVNGMRCCGNCGNNDEQECRSSTKCNPKTMSGWREIE